LAPSYQQKEPNSGHKLIVLASSEGLMSLKWDNSKELGPHSSAPQNNSSDARQTFDMKARSSFKSSNHQLRRDTI
jgi:hypothetical protein